MAMWLSPLTSTALWSSPANCTAASIFATLVASIVSKGLKDAQEKAKKTPDVVKDSYDFIVIGAGSTGCTIAGRISEVPSCSVLLLEAGAEETEFNMVPSLYNRYLTDAFFDWKYSTQKSGWDVGKSMPRGKGLGGSSAVNAMHFTRGNRADFSHWERELGVSGWSYEEVLPYFKKSENNLNPEIARDTKYHGTGGPQDVELDRYLDPNTARYMAAWQEAGFEKVEDVNGAKQIGVSRAPSSVAHGERRSTNRAFLGAAVRKRPNLTVQTGAFVRRVIVSGGRAVGVEYDGPAGRKTVHARKEVIVSAGAYNSPQVLMLSGIGPKAHLTEVGIPVVLDLPGVGQRLHDHMYAKGQVKWKLSKTASFGSTKEIIAAIKQYVETRKGPLTSTSNQGNLFYRSSYVSARDDRPDIQIPLGGSQSVDEPNKSCAQAEASGTYYNQLGFNAINVHPKSRGQILLNKTNPFGMPLIYHNVFGDESDLKPIIEAYKLVAKLNATKTFRENGVTLSVGSPAKCANLTFNTDAFWKCTFNGVGASNGHPVASCSMGPASDRLAVVDFRLKVRGMKNLRVADAAVVPEAPSGNTNAVCIMVGERAADFIKEDWKSAMDSG